MNTFLEAIWNMIKYAFYGYMFFFVIIPVINDIGYNFGRELAKKNNEVTISYGLHGLCVTHRNQTRCE